MNDIGTFRKDIEKCHRRQRKERKPIAVVGVSIDVFTIEILEVFNEIKHDAAIVVAIQRDAVRLVVVANNRLRDRFEKKLEFLANARK